MEANFGKYIRKLRTEKGLTLTQLGAQFIPVELTQTSAQFWKSQFHANDIVIHCAALSSPWGAYRDFYAINVHAT